MFNDVKDKVGVITGGNGRLGKTFANALGQFNKIYLFDVQNSCTIESKMIHYCQVDITEEQAVLEAVDKIVQSESKIDFLINNAALQVTHSFENMTIDDFRKMIDVNLNAAYICIQAVSRYMIPQREGTIVNIGSIYGVVSADPSIYGDSGLNSPDAYAASKAGLIHLTKYLAVNFAKYNIRVNAISPAGIYDDQSSEFLEKYCRKVPIGRMMDREELVGPLMFLLSNGASYITGHNLIVDGGFTAI